MLKERLQMFKGNLNKEGQGNDKRKIENLVIFIIILIVTILIINSIWNPKKEESKAQNINKTLAKENNENILNNNVTKTDNDLEIRLSQILQQIKGVGNVSVMITYSETSKTVPIYNEDNKNSNTEESDSGGGNRKISENTNKKEVVFQEVNGEKELITQNVIKPVAEGAIITAEGASNVEIKTNIIQAVEAVTGLATHKIQVFEMKQN